MSLSTLSRVFPVLSPVVFLIGWCGFSCADPQSQTPLILGFWRGILYWFLSMGSVGIRVAVGQALISPASRRTLLQCTSGVPDQLVPSRSSSSVQRQNLAMAAASNLSIGKSPNIDMISSRRIAATSKNSIVTRSGNPILMSGDGNPRLASVVKLRAYASPAKAVAEAGVTTRYMLRNSRLKTVEWIICTQVFTWFSLPMWMLTSRETTKLWLWLLHQVSMPLLVCKKARKHHLYENCSDILHNHGTCLSGSSNNC